MGGGVGGGKGGIKGIAWPCNQAQIKHIFAKRPGHMTDSPANRKLLEDLVNDPANIKAQIGNGVVRYTKIEPDGKELWADVRYGVIQNGGKNDFPKNP